MGPVDAGLALIPEVLGAALLVQVSALLLPRVAVSLQAMGYSAGEAQQLMTSLLVQSIEQAASVLAFHDAFFASVVFGWLTMVPALFLYQR